MSNYKFEHVNHVCVAIELATLISFEQIALMLRLKTLLARDDQWVIS